MQISNFSNNQNFKGIQLSSNRMDHVKSVAEYLNKTGFNALGCKTVVTDNTFKAKMNAIKNIREKATFYDRDFGAVFFPWSGEAYIIAKPEEEQMMLPVIKHCDEKAKINLLL